jgi:hypothetical protein
MKRMSKKGGLLSLLVVAALAIAAIGMPASGAAATSSSAETASPDAADASCSGLVCVWYEAGLKGQENWAQCTTGIQQIYGVSAMNGCGDRAVWLLSGNPQQGWHQLVCMNPGGERTNPGTFGGVEVLNTGTRC